MIRRGRLVPATLFGRALLTLILTFGLFALVTFGALVFYALLPVAQRSAADLASIMVLSARTLHQLPPSLREDYRTRLDREYQIRLAEERPLADQTRYFFPYLRQFKRALAERLGRPIEVVTSVANGERWFWVALDVGDGTLWTGFPRSRLGTRPLQALSVIFGVAVLLIVGTAAILAGRITQPLQRLSKAAEQVAQGFSPHALPETGPAELANLARQFNATSRQIRELLANRTLLLTGVSHDLRTPLTRLRLAVEMLPAGIAQTLIARMERDIEEMNALITQTIEFGKSLGAGRREDVDLAALIEDLVVGRPRIVWQRGPGCPYHVDALALRRILGNLLENALRYSHERVEVYLDCQTPQPTIFVLDRGPGIPDAERDAVLMPYYRLEASRNRQTGGSGLGLAVAHQLALANQMELRLGVRRGGGTIATVKLPAIEMSANAEANAKGVDGQARGAYIRARPPLSPEHSTMLHAGDQAPLFSLPNADMERVNLEDLIGRRHAVLYFYPKDDTPGCTMEALEFTDLQTEFDQAETEVVGISRDSCTSHGAFRDKYGLTVHLLSDTDGEACEAYGVWREKEAHGEKRMGIVRSTFIVDKQGMIRHALYDVKPKGHAAEILQLARALSDG